MIEKPRDQGEKVKGRKEKRASKKEKNLRRKNVVCSFYDIQYQTYPTLNTKVTLIKGQAPGRRARIVAAEVSA